VNPAHHDTGKFSDCHALRKKQQARGRLPRREPVSPSVPFVPAPSYFQSWPFGGLPPAFARIGPDFLLLCIYYVSSRAM
jgi:hypothetical protein